MQTINPEDAASSIEETDKASRKAVTQSAAPAAAQAVVALTLSACGGGGSSGVSPAPVVPPVDSQPPASVAPTRAQAARFLAQASLSATPAQATEVQSLGYSAWLDSQMAIARSSSNVAWLRSKGLAIPDNRNSQVGSEPMLWRKLLSSPDPLRQRIALALSEIMVISISGVANTSFKQFAAGAFMDILDANAFGSYRTLLEQVSTSVAMGGFLTYKGSRKADPTTGGLPDENYARELMQLFTVGLVQLNLDGSAKRDAKGQALETYVQDDVTQLARVFTGWDIDTSVGSADDPIRVTSPMVNIATRHESGEKRFLGTVIPAGTDGVTSLRLALDTLVAHPNMGPFIGRQLIQRLVTSQPSASYVARVAAVFNNNGAGVKGDLRAVIRAILLDPEAHTEVTLADNSFGKLREPVLRFVQWARTFGITDTADEWRIADLSDPATRLGQSPLRAPSVFNFFRPGYVPPNSGIGDRTAPEFQITTESSVAGYVNFMQGCIANGISGLKPDYTAVKLLVADSAALLAELNFLLAAGQMSMATMSTLKAALESISATSATGANNRLYAALTLVMASPEYITQK